MKATRTCSFPGCTKPYHGTGLCVGHRAQMLRGAELRPLEPRRSRCEVNGCDRKHRANGYCQLHYRRVRNTGDPNGFLLIPDGRKRFETYIDRTETCWLWTGSLTGDGYGTFRENNRQTGAHRFAYEYFIGPIPQGKQLDHLCRVRNCVNPEHLDPVSHIENGLRGRQARSMSERDYRNWVEERTGGRSA